MSTDNGAAEGNVATEGGDLPTVEELQAKLDAANAEAAKERGIRKKLQQERDAAKASKSNSQDEDYKQLWQQESQAKAKLLDKVKGSAIDSAVRSQLSKAGVRDEAIDAAVNLIDRAMVSWDEDEGVETTTVAAAVSKLKQQFGFMFEKRVNAQSPKTPADGSTSDAKTLTRVEFDRLDPVTRHARIKAGYQLTD